MPLLQRKEMIIQNVTQSNDSKGGNTKVEQNFNPGLALIDLLGTAPCIFGSLWPLLFTSVNSFLALRTGAGCSNVG